MRGNQFLDKMDLIDPIYIEAADRKVKRKSNLVKRWCTIAACFCLVFGLAAPAMAGSIPAFYDMLYAVSPATAQFFKPVQLFCEDNGIRMEVIAAYIHEDTAEIYISMQDLEGTRFDETVDLFDSYQINSPFDYTGHCELSSYDPDTQTATFLIIIEQWNKQHVIGDKITFSIREFLSNKKTYEGIIDDVDLGKIELNSATQTVYPRGVSGTYLIDAYKNSSTRQGLTALKPVGSVCSPVNGVTLTSIGYVDDCLHVQVYYEDIVKTDNHGFISLIDREKREIIACDASISFFDGTEEGSYEDYIFTGITVQTLSEYDLYGKFVTSSGSVKGNWSVTFPLENSSTTKS